LILSGLLALTFLAASFRKLFGDSYFVQALGTTFITGYRMEKK
jgi:hypothetical protein